MSALTLTILMTLSISFSGCATTRVVATACPEYRELPEDAKNWIRRALANEDNASFREWLADLAKLRQQLDICREAE